MPQKYASDLTTLAQLAREGNLDLTAVTLRVRTDLMTSTHEPDPGDLRSFVEFAVAALPRISERDLAIVAQKLAQWPNTPLILRQALIGRLPAATELFEAAEAAHAPEPHPQAEAAPEALPAEAPAATAPEAAFVPLETGGNGALPIELVAMARARSTDGDPLLAMALLEREEVSAVELAPLFLDATPQRQAEIIAGLHWLDRLTPSRRVRGHEERIALIVAAAGEQPEQAFAELATLAGGTPDLARSLERDQSRKLAGLALLAAGASVEDAVRFALRLADDSARSVPVVFGLAETLRLASPSTAMRLLRAIGGAQIRPAEERKAAQHVPAADPSGTPERGHGARKGAVTPREAVARLRRQG